MRLVVDTNIVFSAILNTNSKIARIILQPKSRLNFYSTEQLTHEIGEHREKIKNISDYTEQELDRIIILIINKIRFINPKLIPGECFEIAEALAKDVDIDDTEFVALAEHIKGKLWSGDKELRNGLIKKGWNRFITTDEPSHDKIFDTHANDYNSQHAQKVSRRFLRAPSDRINQIINR